MKILYLITKSEAGGAQSHVFELGKFFSKTNEVAVMSYPGGWLENQCKELSIKFIPNKYFSNSFNPINLFRSIAGVKKVLKQERPDIIHCHSSGAGFVGRLAVHNRIPTIFTAHGWGFNIGVPVFQKWIAILAEKVASRYCDKIICVSEFVKNLGLKYKIARQNKLELICNGVEDLGMKLARQDDKIKIIFVGRLAEPKDPLILIKAYQKLPDELRHNVEINIVGDGSKKKELDLFLEKSKVKNVNLLGSLNRERVFDIMAKSDIFVLVSKYEGLPMTILEAMSLGLPVVASDVGGIQEVVKNEENGFLLKQNSPEELKEFLTKLIKDKNLRKTMGENAQKIVENKFSLEKMLLQTEKIYNEILNK